MTVLHRRAILAAVPLLAAPALLRAQAPVVNRTARILAGFPAGGTVDVACRLFAERLRGVWAPQVVVENRVGATGRLAIEELIRSEPDGTSLLVTPASMVTIYPHLYGNRLRYSPMTDMQAVTPVVIYPFAMAVGPAAPNVANLAQFIELAKSRNGISYASPAAGSVPHFTGVMLARAAGIELTHLPYRGAAPAITDAIAGQIPATINVIGDQVEHHRGGRLKMIAVSSAQRVPRFPEVATFAEQGYPDLTADEWFGAFLPARAPASLVQALNAALVAAAGNAELRQNLEAREFAAITSSSAEFAARIQRETTKWGPVVQESGFRPED
ncbi:twin-arginine translocation pathway signal protein [Roseococcus sp. SYP-B2431]|uniref:tripartite tricarboxylate transporter substrate-binding protein n=1 Tax=Roseococcus sp. SYP-B2431 TaxID=2496640 RepID=UPI001039AAD6|nr:tripartite tricarboxylate transporter substrate-binding protein [Roseococcus sp. SYP-B2431]TCH97980.1 twin-arginine translocation pathway signal protein [Roseococcus sp. SYP-B2431]